MSKKSNEGRETTPSEKNIHEYWLGVIDSDAVDPITKMGDYAAENIEVGGCCYACGREGRTQRCHIVPHALGGSDNDVSNYFLMCTECHQHNPDTTHPELFWHYVRNRESYANALVRETYKLFMSLYNEGTDEVRELINEFGALSSKAQLEHHRNTPVDTFSVSLNNRMSMYTGVGAMFLNVVKNPTWKPALETPAPAASASAACTQ